VTVHFRMLARRESPVKDNVPQEIS
jgi:hypothetical protein